MKKDYIEPKEYFNSSMRKILEESEIKKIKKTKKTKKSESESKKWQTKDKIYKRLKYGKNNNTIKYAVNRWSK